MDEHDPGTVIARRHGLVESRMRGDTHVRFGGAGRGTRSSERAIPRPGPTPTRPALRAASGRPPTRQRRHGTRGATHPPPQVTPKAIASYRRSRRGGGHNKQELGHTRLSLVLLGVADPATFVDRGCSASAMLACCTFLRRLATGEVSEDGHRDLFVTCISIL
jgi:hypothetical protein